MSDIVSKFRKWVGAFNTNSSYAPEDVDYLTEASIDRCGEIYTLPKMGQIWNLGNAGELTNLLGFVPLLVDTVGNEEGGGEYSEKVFVLVKAGSDSKFIDFNKKEPEEKLKLIDKYSIGIVNITGNYQSYDGTTWCEINEVSASVVPVIQYI